MSTAVTKFAKYGNLKQVDAKEDFVLNVSKSDCAAGKKSSPNSCPIANSVIRENKRVKCAWIFKSAAHLWIGDRILRFILDSKAYTQVSAFDKKNGVFTPGEYRLLAPTGSYCMKNVSKRSAKRLGRHQPGNTNITRKATKHNMSRHAVVLR